MLAHELRGRPRGGADGGFAEGPPGAVGPEEGVVGGGAPGPARHRGGGEGGHDAARGGRGPTVGIDGRGGLGGMLRDTGSRPQFGTHSGCLDLMQATGQMGNRAVA